MYTRILAILLDIGIIFAAGVWLCWIGIMPIRIGPQKIVAPLDSGLNWFRIFARVIGPIIIIVTSWQMMHDVRRFVRPVEITWRTFASPEGRFQIELPAEPEHSHSDVLMFDRTVTEYKFKAESSEREMTFVISYVDCPPAVSTINSQVFLDNELESRVRSAHVRLLKKYAATVNGCPAVYFSMDATLQGIRVDGYLVLDRSSSCDRLYQMGAQYTDERTESSRKRFLDSFQINRKAT